MVSGWEVRIRTQRVRVYLEAEFEGEAKEVGHVVFESRQEWWTTCFRVICR